MEFSELRIIDLKESILADNDADADKLREELAAEKTVYINVMSSPGSGKTSTILRLVEQLRLTFKVGVLEADIDGDVDTKTMLDAGIPAVQLHTGGMCHLDADMSRQALREINSKDLDIVILENVGNLVCPAEFDTGAHKNIMLLSVPEGHDKPLKYPLMFSVSDIVLINKIDTMDYFDFDMEKAKKNILNRNPNALIFPISAITGEGMNQVCDWFREEIGKVKSLT